jgi:hypothetical protein
MQYVKSFGTNYLVLLENILVCPSILEEFLHVIFKGAVNTRKPKYYNMIF